MLWRHIIGYLPVNAVQGVVSVLTIVLFTRLLDPDAYGRYALVLAATQLVSMACFTWLHAGMARFFEAARIEGRLPQHFATGYLSYAAVALVVALAYLGVVIAVDFSGPIRTALLFGLAALLLRTLLMMGLETHRAARHVGTYGTLEVIQAVGGLGLGAALIVTTGLGEAGPFLGAAVASLTCLLIDLPRIAGLAGRGQPSKTELSRFAGYGLPISVMLALEMIFGVSDRFLIGLLLDDAAVGVYTAGYQLSSRTMDILFAWLGMAAMPLVIAAYERDGAEAARAIARRNAETLIFLGFPAAAGLALVAEPLAAVMVGEQFRGPSAEIVPWIALSALMFGFTAHYVHHAFVLSRRTAVMAGLMVVPAGANIVLNLLLIPRMGLQGAVIGTVIAYALALALCGVVGLRYFPLPVPLGAIGRGLVATAGMAVAVSMVPTAPNAASLLLKILAGIMSYAPLALALDLAGSRRWAAAAVRRTTARVSS